MTKAKRYTITTGIIFLGVALYELVFRNPFGGLIYFTPVHNGFNWLVGALALVAYFKGNGISLLFARVFTFVFLLLFILGLILPAQLSTVFGYPLNFFYQALHLLAGLAGLCFGFIKRNKKETAAPTAEQRPS